MDQKLVQSLNEARMISASEDIIYPLIDKMILETLEKACGKYRSGESQFSFEIAYITALKDLSNVLKSKQTKGTRVMADIHK